jgi:hypothetical protein
MNVTDALATSPNTAFAKLIQQVGVPRAVDMAVRLGLRSYALPGTARAYDPESNESLATLSKGRTSDRLPGLFQLNALELANVAATPFPAAWAPSLSTRYSTATATRCRSSQPCDQAGRGRPTRSRTRDKDDKAGTWRAWRIGRLTCRCRQDWHHRVASIVGPVGFTNQYAAANYIFADSSNPSGICSFPLRECGSGDLYGGNEPARTWFEAMKPIATDFGEVQLPPTDPRYVDGAPEGRVPSVSGLKVDAARQRLKDAGFQVADQTTSVNSSASYGAVVGTTPSGQTFPGSIITINISNGIPPAPPPRPVERPPVGEPAGPGPPPGGVMVVEIPGLPPITVPVLAPPPPAEPPPPPPPPPPPG